MMKYENNHRMNGVSGIMRVKNDADFIEASIKSCIECLDELIIVYNDCSDSSPSIIKKMKESYPDKIHVFEYKYHVLSTNLSEDEYEFAKSLPEDSPRLLCNYYNYALSKINYTHAIKIDADQIYFQSVLNEVCNMVRCQHEFNKFCVFVGSILQSYRDILFKSRFRNIKFLSLGESSLRCLKKYFYEYARYSLISGKRNVCLSGLNVFYSNRWNVTLGCMSENINALLPFNGGGDHMIFRATDDTYYVKWDNIEYRKESNCQYALIEKFHTPLPSCYLGFAWFHLNSMRPNILSKLRDLVKMKPNIILDLKTITDINTRNLFKCMDKRMISSYYRWYFSFVYGMNRRDLKRFIEENIIQIKPFEHQ